MLETRDLVKRFPIGAVFLACGLQCVDFAVIYGLLNLSEGVGAVLVSANPEEIIHGVGMAWLRS